jgi:NAD(P)-dependent dehydrogenase (short-subunit alcohol dehydrogenase family)
LAAEQPNYHIFLCSRNAEKGKEAAGTIKDIARGTHVEPLELDIDNNNSIDKAVNYVEQNYGRLDVLFNNAAISWSDRDDLRKNFNGVLETNVVSQQCLTEACLPLLRKARCPRLVFMSSGLGSITRALDPTCPYYGLGDTPTTKAYIVSKAAENMLGALYAVQLGKEGFKVNMIDPGFRATNLNAYSEMAGKASDGAIQACKIITDESKDGVHAKMTSMEEVYPW